ncbi:MAG: amidohydrolase family protein [Planctomycetaceae bacterium]|nr:amidohydrolase family protein [Planctomycetaceae bacterium]
MSAPLLSGLRSALALLLLCIPLAAQERVDILLQGGTIYDGTTAEPRTGNVAIKGNRLVAVGEFDAKLAEVVIDCTGLVVCPGFIDLHTHSDRSITDPVGRANVNFLTQGCTTIVTGNCGFGPVDVAKYFSEIDSAGAGTHVIHMLPHGSLREAVMGKTRRDPTVEEIEQLCKLADKAMVDGAYGMTTGLIYVPGIYSKTDEIVAVAKVVARHGGIYGSHIRGEGATLLDAVREAIEIGKQAELPVHVSHFKASGNRVWGTLRAAGQIIEQARSAGQRVTADQYPYTASSTSLEATLLPAWAREGGREKIKERLEDEHDSKRLRADVAKKLTTTDRIVIANYRSRPEWLGKSLAEIAKADGREEVDVALDIERNGGASIIHHNMHEDDVRYAMQLPWVSTASDGSAKTPGLDRPHPRSFGTFSRKIGRYAIADSVITLTHAIRSASGLPADILGLTDRGYLKPGLIADVVVFDPKTFRDQATFDDPFRYSTGVRHAFVAGVRAIHEGVPTGALAGKALRKPAAKEQAKAK